ncbi:hypothetical protein LVJ94_48460 [Pendulispora rubella]|uniref:FG-GAP repeat protein n=1 Tax=Pendulispora rubella TaxID=2741070 RepID=A0ABZ2L1N0_9BACT
MSFCLVFVLVVLSGCRKRSTKQDAPVPLDAEASSVKPPPVSAENIGTAHPLLVEAVAPDGHWVVLCQARRDTDGDGTIEVGMADHGDMGGDELEPYFVLGGGEGDRLDAFAGADSTGRYVVFGRGGKLVLFDTFAGQETELSGGLVDDGKSPFRSRASVSFDERGRRLAYVRGPARRPELVVRELASGLESIVSYGPGELWRARLDPGGELVWLDVVVADTNDSGAIELPKARTTLASRRCRGRPNVYGTYGWDGDRPIRRVARKVDGWQSTDARDALGAFGQRLVLRRGGAIVLRDGSAERTLIPPKCHAQIVQADPEHQRLFFGCLGDAPKGERVRAAIERLDVDGTRSEVGFELELRDLLGDADTWDNIYLLYDKATGTIGRWPSGFGLVVHAGDRGLFDSHPYSNDDRERVIAYDAKGERRRFPYDLESRAPDFALRGQRVAIEVDRKTALVPGVVLDLARGETIGSFVGLPLALATSGHVLVPVADVERESRRYPPTGPVHWIRPSPIPR